MTGVKLYSFTGLIWLFSTAFGGNNKPMVDYCVEFHEDLGLLLKLNRERDLPPLCVVEVSERKCVGGIDQSMEFILDQTYRATYNSIQNCTDCRELPSKIELAFPLYVQINALDSISLDERKRWFGSVVPVVWKIKYECEFDNEVVKSDTVMVRVVESCKELSN